MGSTKMMLGVAAALAIGLTGPVAQAQSVEITSDGGGGGGAAATTMAPAVGCLDCSIGTPRVTVLPPVRTLPVPVCRDCGGGWMPPRIPIMFFPRVPRPLVYVVPPPHRVFALPLLPHPLPHPLKPISVALDLAARRPSDPGLNVGRFEITNEPSIPATQAATSATAEPANAGFHH